MRSRSSTLCDSLSEAATSGANATCQNLFFSFSLSFSFSPSPLLSAFECNRPQVYYKSADEFGLFFPTSNDCKKSRLREKRYDFYKEANTADRGRHQAVFTRYLLHSRSFVAPFCCAFFLSFFLSLSLSLWKLNPSSGSNLKRVVLCFLRANIIISRLFSLSLSLSLIIKQQANGYQSCGQKLASGTTRKCSQWT